MNKKVDERISKLEKELAELKTMVNKPKELEVDWGKVTVDTPILVTDIDNNKDLNNLSKRYFAKYEDGIVWAWCNGRTSNTADGPIDSRSWSYAKLDPDAKSIINWTYPDESNAPDLNPDQQILVLFARRGLVLGKFRNFTWVGGEDNVVKYAIIEG